MGVRHASTKRQRRPPFLSEFVKRGIVSRPSSTFVNHQAVKRQLHPFRYHNLVIYSSFERCSTVAAVDTSYLAAVSMIFRSPMGTFQLLILTTVLSKLASATVSQEQGNFTSLSNAFEQLANLTYLPNSLDPYRGAQNFTLCCLLAVNASLEVVNGYIVEKTPCYINASVDDLLAATREGQFPCGAVWNGNFVGAPIVEVSLTIQDVFPCFRHFWQFINSKLKLSMFTDFDTSYRCLTPG